jgi:HSP20 family protein
MTRKEANTMYPSLTTFPGDVFADLERQLDRMLGLGAWPSSIRAVARGSFPALNMGSTGDAVEIYAFAPGLDPARIEVSVDKGLLTITGERQPDTPQPSEQVNVYARERFAGPFKRVVSLPEDADPTGVEATYRDGVLRIVVPKHEARKPCRVEIKE